MDVISDARTRLLAAIWARLFPEVVTLSASYQVFDDCMIAAPLYSQDLLRMLVTRCICRPSAVSSERMSCALLSIISPFLFVGVYARSRWRLGSYLGPTDALSEESQTSVFHGFVMDWC